MSRDRDTRADLDGTTRPEPAGRDMPRGGRSGGTPRPRPQASADVRDVFTRHLDLPRGQTRERVDVDGRTYALRASEIRTLALAGAFRVVDARDLTPDGAADRWHGDLDQLRQDGLIAVRPHVLDGQRTGLVTLTRAGQSLLERHRSRQPDQPAQVFYAGLAKPREASHDAQLARVYAAAAERLHDRGARVQRVVLDYELKREYQRFLQAPTRGRSDASGRPDRSPEDVRAWATMHGLPVVDGHVQFPDVRIEYEHPDGRRDHEDLELATGHYTSRQMAAKRATGFQIAHSGASRLGGSKSRRSGAPFDPHVAEKVLR